jgi:hypothetical protein
VSQAGYEPVIHAYNRPKNLMTIATEIGFTTVLPEIKNFLLKDQNCEY